jgi:hypothetical protein
MHTWFWLSIDVDWDAAQVEITRLQAQGKIIFYQPYALKDKDPKKQPFVVVI